jgi:hypothetical protein
VTRRRAVAGLLALAAAGAAIVVIAVLGGGSSGPVHASGPFAWLHPASTPAGWRVARTPGGASFAYPPGWRAIKTDPGTVSVALLGRNGTIDAYLNATPQQGGETLANWSTFRPHHNGEEGDRAVRVEASTTAARFRSGHGSCVIDNYRTSKAVYREIACLVAGSRTGAVVVAAAPIGLWSRQAPLLERAVATFFD